jgi:Tfp pilus assembly protein PilV
VKNSDGFALVEVLVAGLVLVLVLLGLASISLSARGQLRRSGEQTAATTLVGQRIEWLRNQGYDADDLTAGTTTENLSGTYAGYTRTTTVQDDSPRAGVKQVTVTANTPSGLRFEAVSLIAETAN